MLHCVWLTIALATLPRRHVIEVNADGYTGSGLQHVPHGKTCLPDLFRLVLPPPGGRAAAAGTAKAAAAAAVAAVEPALRAAATESLGGGAALEEALRVAAHEDAVLRESRCWVRLALAPGASRGSGGDGILEATLGDPADRVMRAVWEVAAEETFH